MGDERWDPCIVHRDDDVDCFFDGYFAQPDRKVLLVAGTGFDPRSHIVALRLGKAAQSMRALLFRERRPNSSRDQSDRAEKNTQALVAVLAEQGVERHVEEIEIFAPDDGAVVGGRNVLKHVYRQDLGVVTDVVVDVSALSVSVSFPIIRYFVESVYHGKGPANLHVLVVHDPTVDAGIQSIAGDAPGYVHGFTGGSTLDGRAEAAKLWLPWLATGTGRRRALERLHDFVRPHDICPVLPFPASNPRLGDTLVEEYLTELEDTWSVDTRNFVYAEEGDPLDLYRTVLGLDDRRRPVFEEFGGSVLVLSPLGGKVMALGALMAALERDLPIAYVEPFGYEIDEAALVEIENPKLVHVWLEGDAYPVPRPALRNAGSAAT